MNRPFLLALVAIFLLGCPRTRTVPPDLLTLAIDVGPASFDPRVGSDEPSRRVHQLLYNSLVRFGPSGEALPDLAQSWEQPDPLHYVFHLRPDVRFHDGRLLTSRDVRYTFESILHDEVVSFRKGDLQALEEIATPDDSTVVMSLREPFAPFLSNLSVCILPEGAGDSPATHPVGTGPFRLVESRRDQEIVFAAFDRYFRGRPPCPRLRLKIVPEAISRQQELMKGSSDLVINDLTPDQVWALRSSPDLKILSGPSNSTAYLGFNLDDPVLRQVKVRQAIALALDRRRIIDVLLHGLAHEAVSLLPPDNWAFDPDLPRYDHDPKRAAALLDESGYRDPDGDGPRPRFRLTYKTTTAELARMQASVFQEQLAQVGIEMEIRSFEWGTFYDDIKAGRFQIFSLQWTQLMDPDVLRMRFGSAYMPPQGFNRVRYRNPEVDRLLEAGTRASDSGERRKIYGKIQEILAKELPYVNLWHKSNLAVVRNRVVGFELTPAADFYVLEKVSLDR